MITGYIRADEASVRLVLVGPDRELEIAAIIDTGFRGTLVLPSDLMSEFGQDIEYSESILADGSHVEHQSMYVEFYFPGDINYPFRERAIELGHEPLIGMRLLEGFRLSMDIIEGGSVTIEPLDRMD